MTREELLDKLYDSLGQYVLIDSIIDGVRLGGGGVLGHYSVDGEGSIVVYMDWGAGWEVDPETAVIMQRKAVSVGNTNTSECD
jgi:hypothetical protein